MSDVIAELRAAALLSALDVHLAHGLVALGGEHDATVELAIALLSRHVSQGHVCLPLIELAQGGAPAGSEAPAAAIPPLSLAQWLDALRASPLVGSGAGSTPLVLDAGGRLYFRRYFEHERALAQQVRARAGAQQLGRALDESLLEAGLARYFGATDPDDLQRVAAQTALRRQLTLISGGPGTGKTSTVVKILALLIEQAFAREERAPRMRLMAPTGKAAVRLADAIRSATGSLDCSERVRAAIPNEVSTIHRALVETVRLTGSDALERAKPLAADVVLVDESSMVDLMLMTRLFEAVPPAARVILLGDKDQLASVEAGAVLGDLCGVGLPESVRLAARERTGVVVQLNRSYRYGPGSGIAALARAIQAGDAPRVLEVLASEQYPDVSLSDEPGTTEFSRALAASVLRGYAPYLELAPRDPLEALQQFDRFRVLCAHRRGPRGVESINRAIAQHLFDQGLVSRAEGTFVGRPLLVTRNDYRNRLWNGDVGLVGLDDGGLHGAAPCAWFLSLEGQARRLGLGRLPPYESAFAMSVHKSQGSEVDEVAVVLPREASPVLTRELLYTAVTRARQRVTIHASSGVLAAAVRRNIARSSGLAELLYEVP